MKKIQSKSKTVRRAKALALKRLKRRRLLRNRQPFRPPKQKPIVPKKSLFKRFKDWVISFF